MKVYIEIELDVKVLRFSPADPGRLYGPPENCYPPESAEVDFDLFHDGELVNLDFFTDLEMDSITEQVIEAIESKAEADAEDRR